MSKIVFLDPVDYISGKIAKKFRTIYCYRKSSDRRYTTIHSKHTVAQTELAINARNRFTAVSQAIKARKRDLSKLTDDQQAFLAQRNLPNGKKTMQAYYWLICGQEYDEQHS